MSRHGVRLEIVNRSSHTFRLDGELLLSGDWVSDPAQPIQPTATTRVEFESSQLAGPKGLLWWVDDERHTTYLSIAFSHPKFATGSFAAGFTASAGLPPANLKEELAHLQHVGLGFNIEPAGANCAWRARFVDTLLVIEVSIVADLPRYEAPEQGEPLAQRVADVAAGTPTPSLSARSQECLLSCPTSSSSMAFSLQRFRSRTRPKDLQQGVTRGALSAASGVVAGLFAPASLAYQGAVERGAVGFVRGLGLGLLGGCALAAAGTIGGVLQVGRGIRHTPSAIAGRREEKVWDKESGRWRDVDLRALEADIGGRSPSASGAEGRAVDSCYYDLLGVAAWAGPVEIKRAYYREARECHPEARPEESSAAARFRALTQAYQVLSDPELRERYDRQGAKGLEHDEQPPQVDPTAFFGLLFGSERFLDYTGELALAMDFDHVRGSHIGHPWRGFGPSSDEPMLQALSRQQHQREVQCAVFLRSRLDRLVMQRDYWGFVEDARAEATELASVKFGPELLVELGEMYQIRAEVYLANECGGRRSLWKRLASAKRVGHRTRTYLRFTKGMVDRFVSARRVSDAMRKEEQRSQSSVYSGGSLSDDVDDAVDRALPKFLQAAWAAVVRDIDRTVKHVGRLLLQDKGVPWQLRIRRAQALRALGEVFAEQGARAGVARGWCGPCVCSGLASEAAREAVMESAICRAGAADRCGA